MKLISFLAVGSYATFADYVAASVYSFSDEIIVVNGGYDFNDLSKGDDVLLERDYHLLKEIDIDNKIVQIKPTWEGATPIVDGMKLINPKKDEAGRSRNLSMGVQAAIRRGADLVCKLDSDTIVDPRTVNREKIEALYPNISIGKSPKITNQGKILGHRFGQYDLHGDFYHFNGMPSWAAEDSRDGPSSNDAPQLYAPKATDYYGGGGAPAVACHIVPKQDFHSFHVRGVVPHGVDEYEYFFTRFMYHTLGPWLTGETRPEGVNNIDDVRKLAEKKAKAAVEELKNIDSYNTLGSVDDPKAPKSIPDLMKTTPLAWLKKQKEKGLI